MFSQDYSSEKETVFYFFMLDWLYDEKNAMLENIACGIISFCLTWMPGAYYLGMHHMERAVALEPDEIEYKKAMLLFFEVPERPLSIEKARFYANQILEVDPEYESAHRVLAMIKTMKERNEISE
ncbi:MAG: hypothetical protein LBI13_02565 [Streptococcaceae bacterium]|jgi:hypothetical protein|nr:hypothetical protein [Streptococcaceae bacterium]